MYFAVILLACTTANAVTFKQLLRTAAGAISAGALYGLNPVFAADNIIQTAPVTKDGLYELKKVMSILPGIGTADIYYPLMYQGEWEVQQDIVGIIDNSATVNGKKPNLALRYEAIGPTGVIKYQRVYSKYDDKVILDRGVSTQNLFKQLYATTSLTTFDPSNPNLVNVVLPDNLKINLLTTKRATEDPQKDGALGSDNAVGYSEFVRIFEDNGVDEPSLYGYRLLARYKVDPNDYNHIIGQERLYIYTDNDADGGSKALEVIKSKITMNRLVK